MTPREIVLGQIHFRETFPVPYTLDMSQTVVDSIDGYYGNGEWRGQITQFVDAAHRVDLPVFNHCCGSVAAIMPDIVEIGLDVLESVQPEATGNDPYLFKREYGKEITFWGGLGSQSIIPFGTPEALRTEIRRLIRVMGKGGGYLLSPAKSLMEDTPVENAIAILETFTQQNSD